jgi:hypothetical protein
MVIHMRLSFSAIFDRPFTTLHYSNISLSLLAASKRHIYENEIRFTGFAYLVKLMNYGYLLSSIVMLRVGSFWHCVRFCASIVVFSWDFHKDGGNLDLYEHKV